MARTDESEYTEEEEMPTPAERREAYRVQRELLAVLHRDGEARTRAVDARPPRNLFDSVTTFAVGVLLGALGTFAALSGRLATVETTLSQHGAAIAELKSATEEARASSREILGLLRSPSQQGGARR